MKRINFKKLHISNFRGVESMSVDFSDITTIVGDNGTGKSSVKNAILWLLTNSDEYDRINYKLFNDKVVQTKENSKILSVDLTLDIDGYEYQIKKVASIGWTRKKNHSEYERKGSDNYSFFIDGIERNATDYKKFIEENICPIEKLKFILNTNYSMLLDWKELRKHFEDMVGEIKDSDFTGDYSMIEDLLERYNHNIDDIKAYLRPRINELYKKVGRENAKGELEIQIDTLISSLPSLDGLDGIEDEIKGMEEQIRQIDEQISGSSKGIQTFIEKRNEEVNELNKMKSEYSSAEIEYNTSFQQKVSEAQNRLNAIRDENYSIVSSNDMKRDSYKLLESLLPKKKEHLDYLNKRREALLEKNKENKMREFDDYNCPFCGQSLPDDKIEENKAKFEQEKERLHQSIVEEGKAVKMEIEKYSEELKRIEDAIKRGTGEEKLKPTEDLEAELCDLKTNFTIFKETKRGAEMLAKIEEKEANMTVVPKVDNSALVNMKSALMNDIKEKTLILGAKNQYDSQKKKIENLQEQLRNSACELALLEGKRDAAEQYDREKANIIYNRVNGNFGFAKVEMTEINKSGERVDTCRILDKNGVDMRVTNTASKVLCGADISMAFAKKEGIVMPLILDDMEKVNENNLPSVEGQLVLLKFDYCDFTIKND